MTVHVLNQLAALVEQEREALLLRWRQQVRELPSARSLDVPTLNDHIPGLLDELKAALRSRSDETIPEALAESSPMAHGLQRLQDAFDIEEVVAEYNILRACIHDLADAGGLSLQGKPFHILNRVFDHAIGLALQAYATQRALEVQQRREEYLAFVAHDLRTPLTAISFAGSVLEVTLRQQSASAETARMLRTLHRSVRQLEGLVGKILEENANLQTEAGIKLERREFDLWPLVEALIHDIHPVAGTASTQLTNQVPDDLVVYADASLLKRVFQNLIGNAIRYTPRGQVRIGARESGAEGTVECWVSDSGAGIPSEELAKVFDKGETDPEHAGGAGLGLAIVKTFIEAHGGTVSVESEEQVGSTFRFSLPTRAIVSARTNR
ncbi:MAG TPA: HAMP domain-containing sensor histidine kinase [Burkholderiales bacterium]|nr:HAMP domain-containing sensor histidine kinase [Burkholderiales bacterium]